MFPGIKVLAVLTAVVLAVLTAEVLEVEAEETVEAAEVLTVGVAEVLMTAMDQMDQIGTFEMFKKLNKKIEHRSHCLGMSYFVNYFEEEGSNGFHIK